MLTCICFFFSPGSFLGSWENSRLCRWCYNALTRTKSLWSWWVSREGRCIRTLWFLKATESKEIKSNLVELLFCKLIATSDLFTPSQLIAHGSSRMFQNLFKNMSYKIQSKNCSWSVSWLKRRSQTSKAHSFHAVLSSSWKYSSFLCTNPSFSILVLRCHQHQSHTSLVILKLNAM